MHEINLLPPSRRISLRTKSLFLSLNSFLLSLAIGLGILTVLGGIIIAILWLMPFNAALTTENELSTALEKYQTARQELADHNQLLEQISIAGRQRLVWSDFLNKFLAVIPPGITIRDISGSAILEDFQPTSAQVNFSGNALSRGVLQALEQHLETLPDIATVNSPASNLLERANINYQLNANLSLENITE